MALLTAALGATRAPAQSTPPPPPEPTSPPVTTPAIVTLRPRASALREGGSVTVDVFLSKPLSKEATFSYSLVVPSGAPLGGLSYARLSQDKVTFAAGQTHSSVMISAPDDDLRYLNADFFVSVFAVPFATYPANSSSIMFLDNDAPRLTLRPSGTVWQEGTVAESPLLFIESNVRDIANSLNPAITVRSSRTDVVRVPTASVQLPSLPTGLFPLQVLERPGFNAPTPVMLTAEGPGLPTVAVNVLVVDSTAPALKLSLSPSVIDEDAQTPSLATVSRSGDTSKPLLVSIGNSNPHLVRAPTSVTIPAGSSSIRFSVSPIESKVQDMISGPNIFAAQRTLQAILSASSGRLASARARMDVRETTPIVEAIASPIVLVEEDSPYGTLVLRLARPRAQDVPVRLKTPDSRIALGASNIVLPRDGRKVSVRFRVRNDQEVQPVDGILPQGGVLGEITVYSDFTNPYLPVDFPLTTTVVEIKDDDAPLSIRVHNPRIRVVDGTATFDVTVVRREASANALPVRLSAEKINDGRFSLLLPPVVTIPAGQRRVTVSVRVSTPSKDSGYFILRAAAGSVSAFAFSSFAPEEFVSSIFQASQDSALLSPSARSSTVVLRRIFFDVPVTLRVQPTAMPEGESPLVAAPALIRIPAGQEYISIPLRLLRDPRGDKSVEFRFSVVPDGRPAISNDWNRFHVQVRTDDFSLPVS